AVSGAGARSYNSGSEGRGDGGDSFLSILRGGTRRTPRGTRKPRIPCWVEAHTTAMSAIDPLVIHILEPDSIQSEPSRVARVFMLDGSLPWSGSVRPKHPTACPAAIRGSHSVF